MVRTGGLISSAGRHMAGLGGEETVAAPGPRHGRRRADRLPEWPPDNELPTPVDLGPLVWRSGDVGVTVTGFMAYSTGVAFTVVALSKGVSLRIDDDFEDAQPAPAGLDLGAGSLKFGARRVPVSLHSWSRGANRHQIEAWAPFPPDGDLVFYLEWPAEGIEYSEFRVPRDAAATAVVLWPPDLLVELRRQHEELTPSFLIHVEPWAAGTDLLRLRVAQNGPPGIDRLDSLALCISNDDSYWPDERNVAANGHNYEEVRNQVWAPYRFKPGTGPGQARADRHGREVTYQQPLRAGQELAFQLEPTRPGSWFGRPPEEWQRQRGNAIRFVIISAHHEHGSWHLAGKITVAPAAAQSAIVSRAGMRRRSSW